METLAGAINQVEIALCVANNKGQRHDEK